MHRAIPGSNAHPDDDSRRQQRTFEETLEHAREERAKAQEDDGKDPADVEEGPVSRSLQDIGSNARRDGEDEVVGRRVDILL